MSRALASTGPAPETWDSRFLRLLFGIVAAPLVWLGQMMLAYSITAHICYPGDHPVTLSSGGALFATLVATDLIALAVCASGTWASCRAWTRVAPYEGRNRFLALGGVMFSLCFFAAILFNVIASLMVPLCQN